MSINWKVRFKNKAFVVAFVGSILLLMQQVLAIFGVTVDFSTFQVEINAVIGTVFTILALLGIVTDPTTAGVGDSDRAMTYVAPGTPADDDNDQNGNEEA